MNVITKSVMYGMLGSIVLLGVYFLVLTLVSGWNFAQNQFSSFWYFIVSLAAGFGVQIGLYSYIKNILYNRSHSGSVLAVSGTTSTAAMISCCSHYLVNMLPIIGITSMVSFIGQYQIQFFWIGLLFNAAGIVYIARSIIMVHHR